MTFILKKPNVDVHKGFDPNSFEIERDLDKIFPVFLLVTKK